MARAALIAASLTVALSAFSESARQWQPPAQWGNLDPGPHAVGFDLHFDGDPSRRYFPTRFTGEADLPRPIQIAIWYPARPTTGAEMTFGAYLEAESQGLGPGSQVAADSLPRGFLRPYYEGPPSDEDWARVTGSRVAGRRGATPASGRYPLLVYAGIGGLSANTILFEYLASHGYVVASVPLLGTSSAWYNRGEWTTAAIETMTEDLAWAFRYAAALPHVDAQRTAVIGMSAGAQGVLFAMQNENVRAIAGFETMFPETVTDAARFDIRALRVPILHLPSEEIADRPTPVFESLRYADRTEAVIEKSTHAASYQFPRLAAAARAKENGRDEVADAHPQYEIMARLVRRFLDWKLKDDAMAGQEMARSRWTEHGRTISLQRTAALPPVPTEAELLAMVRQGRVADVRRIVTEAREREPGLQLFTKAAMTTTARFLERDRGASVAEGVFRLIEEAYPANAISPLTTRGGFVAVVVPDLDESIRWYSEKFGLRLVKRDQSDRASFAILEGGGLIVELIRGDGGAPGSGPRLGVFKAGIFVENLASTVEALKDRAVPIELGPFPKRPDQRANLIIRDNAGNLIQFIEQ